MDLVYLDNNATTPLAPEVLAAMMPFLTDQFGNPSSIHRLGQRARQAVDTARSQVAAFIGASDSEISFTGGGTEAVNTAIRGILATRAPRKRVVTTTVEHSATRELCKQLEKEGFEVLYVAVDQQGTLDLDHLATLLDETTALATTLWANNETGVLFPVQRIAEICKSHRVPFHVDATQAIGKVPVNVRETPVEAMCFAPHKFHGPKGVGGLYVRRGLRIRPLVIGGPQENSRRGGTENVPAIVGFGKACEVAQAHLPDMPAVARLRDQLESRILADIPDTHVNGRPDLRVPNTTNIGFAPLEAEAILISLSEQNVCASAGAACSSGSLEPSPILRAMGIPDRIAHGAVRFSLSRHTTQQDLDRCLAVLAPTIAKLRAVMPVAV